MKKENNSSETIEEKKKKKIANKNEQILIEFLRYQKQTYTLYP